MNEYIQAALVVVSTVASLFNIQHTLPTSAMALPNPQLTPGAISDTDVHTICSPDYDRSHRPDTATSHSLKLAVMRLYGVPYSQIHTIEADALIPVGIGGNHYVTANVWPQRCDSWSGYRCVAGDAYVKDILETAARRKVCNLLRSDPSAAQQLLTRYQHQFATDWRQVE